MKVKFELTVEIDPEVWANEYGMDWNPSSLVDKNAVREDVREGCANAVREFLARVGQPVDA